MWRQEGDGRLPLKPSFGPSPGPGLEPSGAAALLLRDLMVQVWLATVHSVASNTHLSALCFAQLLRCSAHDLQMRRNQRTHRGLATGAVRRPRPAHHRGPSAGERGRTYLLLKLLLRLGGCVAPQRAPGDGWRQGPRGTRHRQRPMTADSTADAQGASMDERLRPRQVAVADGSGEEGVVVRGAAPRSLIHHLRQSARGCQFAPDCHGGALPMRTRLPVPTKPPKALAERCTQDGWWP